MSKDDDFAELELRALASLLAGTEPTEESFRFRREHNEELRQKLQLISPTGRTVEPPPIYDFDRSGKPREIKMRRK